MADRFRNDSDRDGARARVRRTGWIVGGVALAAAVATVLLILGPWSPDPAELERAIAEDSSVSVPSPSRESGSRP